MVFGMNFIEWMAVIGGYPTIFSTFFLIGVLGFSGTRAIYRYRDYRNAKYHIKETLRYEDEIKYLLENAKPLTKLRFKRLVGNYMYSELTYIETAPLKPTIKQRYIEWRIRKAVDKVLLAKKRRKHNGKTKKRLRDIRS